MANLLAQGREPTIHHAPPVVPERFLRRTRVLDALDQAGDARVICLQAPGGYGKTTALAQWVAKDSRPTVWLTVRAAAADAHWFAQALVEALVDAGLVTDRVALAGTDSPTSWHLSTLPVMENLVSSVAEPFLIAIDDAGAVTGTAWDCLVESLANSLPAGAQLAFTTREAVPATLWRLQSRGEVVVVGPSVLAFDEEEAGRVLDSLGTVSSGETVRKLVERTEGWPVAVYLSGQSMRSAPQRQVSAAVPGGSGLAEYLRAHIVSRLSADDAKFLSLVSVLSRLDQESCDEVAGTKDSLARLRRLSNANRLLVIEDEAAERFRLHPLLAEALSEQLREQDLDAWRSAHLAASHAEERRGDLDGAVHHAKVAGDDERLADLVWARTPYLLASGQWALLQRWLDGLDDQRLTARCGLALSAAWLASHKGDIPRTRRLALAASERSVHEGPSFMLVVDLLAATIGDEGLDHIEAAARAFIDGQPRTDPWQALSHFLLGVALFFRDESEQAAAALHEGYRLSTALDLPVMAAHCLAALADAALATGEEHRALSWIRESRDLATRYRIDTIATSAPVFTTSTVGYVLEGRFADARREAARALRLTALMSPMAPWHAVQGRLALARVNTMLGDPARARLLIDEAGDARGPSTVSSRLDKMYHEARARVDEVSTSRLGASALTTAEVRVVQYLPTHLSVPQIADELFLSRYTVKTQVLSAYRKLGVHSRTEAIDAARRAGLLPSR